MFHNSSSASVFENDNKEARVTTSAAAKKNEEYLDKDAEILRLMEERRHVQRREITTERLEQKLEKMHQRKQRMKRQQDIERILEEFKGVRNIPGTKTAKKRVLITKIKNEKGECITSRKGIADAFGEFHKRLHKDKERDEMSDDKRIPEITTEKLQSAISKLKTANLQTAMEYVLKTSKLATTRREK